MARHKHADLIIAWANGAEIEYFYDPLEKWRTASKPYWENNILFRIKPEPKPDVVKDLVAWFTTRMVIHEGETSNLRLTFDGKTGKLKAAEIINKEK